MTMVFVLYSKEGVSAMAVYAAGHFLVDFVCAWLIFGRFAGLANWAAAALYYNFCAFALQMPLGILADRWGRNRAFAAGGALLVCLGVLPLGFWWSVILAGLGNALYHVGGGRETMLRSHGMWQLGVFVSPGALGIFLGSLLRGRLPVGICAVTLLMLLGLLLGAKALHEQPSPRELTLPKGRGILAVALLFVVVLLRSAVGMCAVSPWKAGAWIWIGAILGAAGKAAGGFAGDRWGFRRAGCVSLLAAGALFLLPEQPLAGVCAGLLFQMSMPITLGEASRRIPGGEGFVFGLMTFALFLGFLLTRFNVVFSPGQTGLLSVCSAGLLLAVPKEGEPCNM